MADLSGKTFGQYQLVEPISSGGMATIYKAYQPALDRVAAVKVLPEYLLAQAGFDKSASRSKRSPLPDSNIPTFCPSMITAKPNARRIW